MPYAILSFDQNIYGSIPVSIEDSTAATNMSTCTQRLLNPSTATRAILRSEARVYCYQFSTK